MKNFLKVLKNIVTFKWLFVGLVLFYKKCISPRIPNSCIYSPSCSSYMLEAIAKHGTFKGVAMGVARIFRCVPFKEGGVDRVKDNPSGEIKWLIF